MDKEIIAELAEKYYPYVRELRHEFHKNPELSWKEIRTSRRVMEELERMGVPYQAHCGNETNVAAYIKGSGSGLGKTIMLRADMDALPIQEDESHELCSETPGVMHACAHDGHIASMLGTVRILNELKDQFSGTIKIAFEAGEEDGGGAKDFIKAGFLDDVEAVFGCHLFGTVKEGVFATRVGDFMSASDALWLKIRGRGGHSSTPHLAVDPVNIAAQFITDSQAIVARMAAPTDIAVLGFSTIQGGTVYNTIPDEVNISGSLRCFSEETRELIRRGMEGILKGLCQAYGAEYELRYTNTMYAVHNDERLTKMAVESAAKVVGSDHIDLLQYPQMGSETFAFYREKAPCCLYYLGIDAGDRLPVGHNAHHNSSFCWRDENLKPSVQCMAQIAMDYMCQ